MYKQLENADYLIDGNMLYINGTETYMPGILNKTLHAMEIITTKLNIEYDFILRTNASTVINYIELYNFIETSSFDLQNNYYYIGNFLNLSWLDPPRGIIDNTYHGTKYSEGVFILINKLLALNIINNSHKLVRNIIDDVSIGQYINTLDIVHCTNINNRILVNHINFNNNLSYIAFLNHSNKDNRVIDVSNFKFQIEHLIMKPA
jgi:hypothetical protein